MTATNHALTGTAIGFIVGQPLLALPLALVSHYICDALPHYRSALPEKELLKSRGFRRYLIAEAAICFLIVAALAGIHPEHWLLASICAFLATAPDLLSIKRYAHIVGDKHWQPGRYVRFASRIQWFERPIGAAVEVAWLVAMLVIIRPFLVR